MEEKKRIQKGFNDAYLLQKFKPELAQKLALQTQDKNDPYSVGFADGQKQWILDEKERRKNLIYQRALKSKKMYPSRPDRDRDMKKGKDREKDL